MSKLTNLKGRINYISSKARQENLYAVYETTGRNFWAELAECNQQEFAKSGTEGKCIEARELIIALPESFTEYDPDALLKIFTDHFKQQYGVECIAALHHNKRKTNYHIHLIFSERKLLDQPEEKIASRNMFYDESGKHVRTKKEIIGAEGNLRDGCRVIRTGEVYERNIFTIKDPLYKSEHFLDVMKQSYTELINLFVKNEKEKLTVFNRDGVYLPMKKIGKNNPKAEEIAADNQIRKEWNSTVDMALVSGMPENKLLTVKNEQVSEIIRKSISENGRKPEMLSDILRKAIAFLNRIVHAMEAPKKPVLKVNLEEFHELENIKAALDGIRSDIIRIEKRIIAKQDYIAKLRMPWKKLKANKELAKLLVERSNLKDQLEREVRTAGYPNVQKFMKTYNGSVAAIQQYKKELAAYRKAVDLGEIKDPDMKRSLIARLKELQTEGKNKASVPKKSRDKEESL